MKNSQSMCVCEAGGRDGESRGRMGKQTSPATQKTSSVYVLVSKYIKIITGYLQAMETSKCYGGAEVRLLDGITACAFALCDFMVLGHCAE